MSTAERNLAYAVINMAAEDYFRSSGKVNIDLVDFLTCNNTPFGGMGKYWFDLAEITPASLKDIQNDKRKYCREMIKTKGENWLKCKQKRFNNLIKSTYGIAKSRKDRRK